MINVMRSEMGHELRKYISQGKPDVVVASSLNKKTISCDNEFDNSNSVMEITPDVKRNEFNVESEMEMLEELERYEMLRDKGYKVARAAVKGNTKLEKYVELVFELPDYRAISKRMKITLTEVKELEAELISIFAAE